MEVAPELGHRLATIRPSAAPMVRVALRVFGMVLFIGLPLALWKGRTAGEIANGLCAAALLIPALTVFLTVVVQPLGLQVHTAGLAGRTFWGARRSLAWDRIAELRTDATSGVTLLLIVGRNDDPILWTLPDVVDRPEFQHLACQLGTPESPLVRGGRYAA
jgi:hypothetical protein